MAELHVVTWNATYRTAHGPTVETRRAQWENVFRRAKPLEFVTVLESGGRLIGFAFGCPCFGEFEGVLSKIFLRWEYHGLGLEFEAGAGDILVIKASEVHSFNCIGSEPLVPLDVHLSDLFIQENPGQAPLTE